MSCLACDHDKGDHRPLCRGKDLEGGVEYDCNCSYYESKSTSSSVYCDSCLTTAYDAVGDGAAEQSEFLDLMGELLPDHECDHVMEPDVIERCDCLTHKSNRSVTA